ncbi:MAG: tRNA 2-selenouridine(34) synthase MnmH [Betaproteobacteria bacterium]|nr:MAG: tRNA 2-selenouridine(34) synthase MnmH [Betaproteobacteria bacterium]
MNQDAVNVAQLEEFDEIVDVRSPSEYELDRVPGAINCPVLFDDERVRVGTIHAHESSFAAKKVGAALVARNIARHLEDAFADKPRRWRPLIYCWRGGQRSASMTSVLRQTGWDARRLEGGYKAFRRHVITDTDHLVARLSFNVVCGLTGSGKSALLRALEDENAQVLDLERIAEHRGSVLGAIPGSAQPRQKMFESRVWQTLKRFDLSRCVYVEAESRRIGDLRLPESVMDAMRASPCVTLQTTTAVRVQLLLREYRHLVSNPAGLTPRLDALVWLHGRRRVARWNALVSANDWESLVRELLEQHYDPAYRKSSTTNYAEMPRATALKVTEGSPDEFVALAQCLIADEPARRNSPDARARNVA